ncbi:unnamed protein product [Prorocentrum cordatum]|nr:unnamed protein product [Polarella glacialis]
MLAAGQVAGCGEASASAGAAEAVAGAARVAKPAGAPRAKGLERARRNAGLHCPPRRGASIARMPLQALNRLQRPGGAVACAGARRPGSRGVSASGLRRRQPAARPAIEAAPADWMVAARRGRSLPVGARFEQAQQVRPAEGVVEKPLAGGPRWWTVAAEQAGLAATTPAAIVVESGMDRPPTLTRRLLNCPLSVLGRAPRPSFSRLAPARFGPEVAFTTPRFTKGGFVHPRSKTPRPTAARRRTLASAGRGRATGRARWRRSSWRASTLTGLSAAAATTRGTRGARFWARRPRRTPSGATASRRASYRRVAGNRAASTWPSTTAAASAGGRAAGSWCCKVMWRSAST